MRRPINSRFLVPLLIAFAITTLHAFVMIPLAIERLAKESDLIVRGEVLSKTCLRDAKGRIYTQTELEVTDVWKGTLTTNRVTIVQGGGVLGEEQVVVSGQVQYDIGEEVVAFLVFNEAREAVTLGMTQGKFHVHRATSSKKPPSVHNPFHGLAPEHLATSDSKKPAQPLTLDALKAQVLAAK